MTDLTRRRLVQAAGATGATLWLGPALPGTAQAAALPRLLKRSGYTPLIGQTFTADGVALTLTAVADLARAKTESGFVGRDDAFAAMFTGPADNVLEAGMHTLSHPAAGSLKLFLVPVDRTAGAQEYELIVDRSVPRADYEDAPEPLTATPAPAAAPAAAAATPKPAASTPATAKPGRTPLVTFAGVAWRGGVLTSDVRLDSARRLTAVRVTLVRKGKVYARGSKRLALGKHAARVPLRRARTVQAGDYELLITTTDRRGKHSTVRRRVTLR